MSIITEALKRAEREKDKAVTSKEYMNKILGPERKETYQREELKDGKTRESKSAESIRYVKRKKALVVSGGLLVLTIMFLAISNVFLLPSLDLKTAEREKGPVYTEEPLVAEAYTDMSPEIALIKSKTGFIDKFLPNFTLNGIVWDIDGSWAIINDKIVRAGDALDGAKVISIEPQKVVLSFRDKRFDLTLK